MLSNKIIVAMAKGARNLIPEYQKSVNLRNDIIAYIKNLPTTLFNDKDKEMVQKYPNYIKYQTTMDIAGRRYYYDDKRLGLPREEWEDIFELRDYSYYTIPLPATGFLYIGDNICDFYNNFPEESKELIDKVKKLMETRNKYIIRLNKIVAVLKHEAMTLTIVKTNFPELYVEYKKFI